MGEFKLTNYFGDQLDLGRIIANWQALDRKVDFRTGAHKRNLSIPNASLKANGPEVEGIFCIVDAF